MDYDLNSNKNLTFQYTKNNSFLTDEERTFYEVNGYLIFKNLVDHDILDECKQRFINICEGKVDQMPLIVMKDYSLRKKNFKGELLVNKIQDFVYDSSLCKYITYQPMVNIISSIIGPNVTAFHSMLINKPPNADPESSLHPLHQDLHYFPFRPANSIVGSWTAMEHVDEKNGCLYVVPGTHKGILHKHVYPPNVKNKAYHGVRGLENVSRVNLPMEKGDTVLFHPLLLHGSGPNFTNGFRKAISTHYADSDCYFIDVKGTNQEIILKEAEEIFKKKEGMQLKFEDIWKFKSRVVLGNPGRFQQQDNHL